VDAAAVEAAVKSHPAVRCIRLVGSRAEGSAHELSDWDFAVETTDFGALSRDLPQLVAPLRPLAVQWDPYSNDACYMLMFPGPTKVDLFFPDEPRSWSAAWEPSGKTLAAIDRHFWDWILWLEQKRSGAHVEVLGKGLRDMYALMLRPLGVVGDPETITQAIDGYLEARSALERRFDVRVPRELEHEVLPAVLRRQHG
jgi:hypothetical protein